MAAAANPPREWSGREVHVLVRLYPSGGMRACAPALPDRTTTAIYSAANQLGLKRAGRKLGSGRRRS